MLLMLIGLSDDVPGAILRLHFAQEDEIYAWLASHEAYGAEVR